MKTVGYLTLVACALLAACNADQAAPLPESTTQQLMANEVQPTAEIYWDAVQYISDLEGDHDIFPQNDEEWERTRAAAAKLGDYGRLLATAEYSEGRGDDWLDYSRALVEVSERAEQTAIDRNVEDVFEVGGIVYRVCSGCHLAYPPENMPE